MRLFVPEGDARLSLSACKHPWFVNLLPDFRIVAVDFEPRGGLAYVLWSATFASVQPGDPIPEFQGEYNGLRWRKV